MKKYIATFLVILVLVFLSAPTVQAHADSLIIHDDGNVTLIITYVAVLGVSDDKTKSTPPTSPLPSQHPSPSSKTTEKTVPLTPAHTESKITVTPPINNDNKIQVTITTLTPTQNPNSPIPLKNLPVTTNKTIEENVDQIIAQGSDEKPILTITSPGAHELLVQQQNIDVTTSLPLQIDSLTHSLGVPSSNESAKISVLPSEAVQGVLNKGLLDNKSLHQMKINLTKDSTGINYTVQSERQGKLFGILPMKSPVQVILSAQNGKVVKVSQSILFTIFGWLIK